MGKDHFKKIRRQFVSIRKLRIPAMIRDDIDILLIIFAAALFLRIYFAFVVNYSPNSTITDASKVFDGIALGDGWDTLHPPLYPFFLRVVYTFAGDSNHAAVCTIQGVLSSITVFFMYVMGRLLCDRAAGIAAAAISAAYPNFLIYNLTIYPDSLTMIVVVLIMAAAVTGMTEKRRAYISAALIGIGILVRPLLVYMIPGMILTSKKKVLFIAVAAALLAPWAVRNSVVRHGITPVYEGKAYEIDLRKFSARYEKWGPVHKLYYNASTILRKGWTGTISGDDGRQRRNINYIAAYGYLFVMICGLLGLARYYEREHRPLVWPILGYIFLLIPLTNVHLKQRIYIEPLWILYTAVFLTRTGEIVLKRLRAVRSRGSGQAAPV